MMRHVAMLWIVVLAVAFLIAAQKPTPSDPFLTVPEDKREQLRADALRAVELQKHSKWKEFEAVYDKDYPIANPKKKVHPIAIRDLARATRLVEFAPMSVQWQEGSQSWMITGCAAYDDGQLNGRLGYVSSMSVRYIDGQAKFLPVSLLIVKDQGMQRCEFVHKH